MPWYRYSSLSGLSPRPFVRVGLWHGASRVEILALVDSGADTSVVAVNYATGLGLDKADAETVRAVTAGGDIVRYLRWPAANLELEFDGRRFRYAGGFIEFPARSQPTNLLGRSDFFQQYIVQFWEAAQLMNIDLAPQFSHPPIHA